ncbi:MAG TPA: alanine--tRNA ligase [Candidatus Nanoarchaeia archaeon]|nr:alanine--tRNA ligase [Candidatus Nanoarchaeia archaeon]
MLSKKELVKKYRPIFWKDPDKYYPTVVLKAEGFTRNICKTCKKPFWNVDASRKICGDPSCAVGESFAFINKTPAKNAMSYADVWKNFSEMFRKFGYTPISRYPVVARWNPTADYVMASISAFQPYVISGEVKPPANPLTIPQFCMRFNDVDNVGITMSHFTGFVMIGQHMFVPPKDWDQNKAFKHWYTWWTQGLGIPKDELTFMEDTWAGGGNLGCCIECFSRGCELGNQVYMLYEVDGEGNAKDLKLKVLDMGMGMERNAWFSQGLPTSFDAVFPHVIKKLLHATGYQKDDALLVKFVPYAGMLNIDEVEDIDKAWTVVGKKLGVNAQILREKMEPLSGIYSVAEHARTLLFAFNDGALPSNVGGGYNLRILLRRALSFIERYDWKIHLPDVCVWHAEELKPLFPELSLHLDDVRKILEVEMAKFASTKQMAKQVVEKLLSDQVKIDTELLLELYDSKGVSPNIIKDAAGAMGKEIHVPDNFYSLVAERQEKRHQIQVEEKEQREALDLTGVVETKALYYDDWLKKDFEGKVAKVIGKHVVLESTYFYPTSGGQEYDTGTMEGIRVVNVFKQGPYIVQLLEKEAPFKVGQKVKCQIDWHRRFQLAQHHTGTHVLNAAARRVLGHHINQAGAKKTVEKAHLDITHYESLDQATLDKIETEANKIVKEEIHIKKAFMPRDAAEKAYGMEIYQGGAVPGQQLRIVEIPEVDVECCGGTHLDNTSQIGKIKILKAQKIQDGVVRLTFVAGTAADAILREEGSLIEDAAKLLGCKAAQVPKRSAELFEKWKKAKKLKSAGKPVTADVLKLMSTEESTGDLVQLTAQITKTQPDHIMKTLKRFKDELEASGK